MRRGAEYCHCGARFAVLDPCTPATRLVLRARWSQHFCLCRQPRTMAVRSIHGKVYRQAAEEPTFSFQKPIPRCEVKVVWPLLACFAQPLMKVKTKESCRWQLVLWMLTNGSLWIDGTFNIFLQAQSNYLRKDGHCQPYRLGPASFSGKPSASRQTPVRSIATNSQSTV